ncbi:hypothetical protein BCF11_4935 [Collimonas sp. PA-H2]|nr:hypothetical protein BCF11_4935 [Collimonas sp. PA-H2]
MFRRSEPGQEIASRFSAVRFWRDSSIRERPNSHSGPSYYLEADMQRIAAIPGTMRIRVHDKLLPHQVNQTMNNVLVAEPQ